MGKWLWLLQDQVFALWVDACTFVAQATLQSPVTGQNLLSYSPAWRIRHDKLRIHFWPCDNLNNSVPHCLFLFKKVQNHTFNKIQWSIFKNHVCDYKRLLGLNNMTVRTQLLQIQAHVCTLSLTLSLIVAVCLTLVWFVCMKDTKIQYLSGGACKEHSWGPVYFIMETKREERETGRYSLYLVYHLPTKKSVFSLVPLRPLHTQTHTHHKDKMHSNLSSEYPLCCKRGKMIDAHMN